MQRKLKRLSKALYYTKRIDLPLLRPYHALILAPKEGFKLMKY